MRKQGKKGAGTVLDPPIPEREFTVQLLDPTGKVLDSVKVMATDVRQAFKRARRFTARFQLPGWRLQSEGVTLPLVKFIDHSTGKKVWG